MTSETWQPRGRASGEAGAAKDRRDILEESQWSRVWFGDVKHHLDVSEIHGLGRLTLDAARMITDVVEDAHATVLGGLQGAFLRPSFWLDSSTGRRTSGIPGLVYGSIHAGFDVAEACLNVAAGIFGSAPRDRCASTLEHENRLAVLNGIWGDHLAASGNPLAIKMAFRYGGVPFPPEAGAIRAAIGTPGRKVLVLVHGLCMSDLGWEQGGHDHGAELACDLGYTPVYLHYNTGLRISTNGKRFAEMLEFLIQAWPEPVEELTIIGHSMGGLVARSAAYYGERADHTWLRELRRLVFVGTPHHGSRVERAGHLADQLLTVTPYSAPFVRLGASRSAGIIDLRHGSLVDEDWRGHDRLGYHRDIRRPVPLSAGVECYAFAATLGTDDDDPKGRLMGDGLVPVNSALGIHRDPARDLGIPTSHQWVGCAMSHRELLRRPEVYSKLQDWLRAPCGVGE